MSFFSKLFKRQPSTDLRVVWDDVKPRVAGLAQPAIRLTKTASPTRSWFGGRPLVNAADFVWPESDGKPMAFLGQLDLAELTASHRFPWLPAVGSAVFFYDVEQMPWGFDPKDKGKWRVLYSKTVDTEMEYPASLPPAFRMKHSFVSASRIERLPDIDSAVVEALNLSQDQLDAYAEFSDGDEKHETVHQVGGFPSPVQGNMMELECQLASNGIYVGTPEGYEDPRAQALEAGARDWRLLLQIDSDDELDLMWGDAGMIYFWVREQDSLAMRFDGCWLILQCS